MKHYLTAILIILSASSAWAAIKIEPVVYKQGDTTLKSWVAYDDAVTGPRPGILVFPEWWGMAEYPKHRIEQLAKLGYVALAADIYGDGKTTADPKEAGALAGPFMQDRSVTRARAAAALDALRGRSDVDKTKIAAIGYCFGGMVALELARSGADVVGVVSFHGNLTTGKDASPDAIKGKVLICHGGDDAFVPPDQVQAFEDEMRKAKVDWQFIAYGGAHHAFTNPDADKAKMDNVAYNADADRRSWKAMEDFFNEIFGRTAVLPAP